MIRQNTFSGNVNYGLAITGEAYNNIVFSTVPVVVPPDTIAVCRLIAGRSLARLIVPVNPGEPAPLSSRFVTVKFATL